MPVMVRATPIPLTRGRQQETPAFCDIGEQLPVPVPRSMSELPRVVPQRLRPTEKLADVLA